MIVAHADGLHTVDVEKKIFGLPLGARMTVLRLSDGGLLLHSPVALSDEDLAAVRALGPVRHLVGPNQVHHLFLGHAAQAFPDAKLWGAPGLPKKRADLAFAGTLGETPLDGDLEQHVIGGMPGIHEVAFLHRPTRTLVLTDVLFHFRATPSFLLRTYLKASGAFGRPAQTSYLKSKVKDRAAFAASAARILSWDFDRLVVAHGEVLSGGAKEAVRAALA